MKQFTKFLNDWINTEEEGMIDLADICLSDYFRLKEDKWILDENSLIITNFFGLNLCVPYSYHGLNGTLLNKLRLLCAKHKLAFEIVDKINLLEDTNLSEDIFKYEHQTMCFLFSEDHSL